MPFFRIDRHLHYFAHVPKCAGSSVEIYLRKRFGSLAFQNSRYLNVPEEERWTRSSPQHVDVEALHLLIPQKWIKSSFAVVRHPVSRLRSAFNFQLNAEKSLPANTDFNDWIAGWAETRATSPFQFDNHARPAHDIVPKGAKIFRMEDGIDGIVAYLDKIEGKARGPRELPHANSSHGPDRAKAPTDLNDVSVALIKEIYKNDFARFGYVCEDIPSLAPRRRVKRSLGMSLTQILGVKK